jgi:hypothetical protein
LIQFVACGFEVVENESAENTALLTSDVLGRTVEGRTSGGIFHITPDISANIDRINFQGVSDLKTKKLHMIGYLLELAYDLCIGTDSNVSSSPGFETCLGMFGNEKASNSDVT